MASTNMFLVNPDILYAAVFCCIESLQFTFLESSHFGKSDYQKLKEMEERWITQKPAIQV